MLPTLQSQFFLHLRCGFGQPSLVAPGRDLNRPSDSNHFPDVNGMMSFELGPNTRNYRTYVHVIILLRFSEVVYPTGVHIL